MKKIWGLLGCFLIIISGIFCEERLFMPEECFKLTEEIVTPHIPWAKPYYRKKLTALVLGPRYRQRETIELKERADINCIPVLLYSERHLWQEGWNWGFEKVKEFTKEYCFKELSEGVMNNEYDVIIIGAFTPLDKFPKEIIEEIKKRVYSGVGLVYIYQNPYGGGKPWDGFKELMGTPTDEGKEFIIAGIPFEVLPGFWQVRTKEGKIDLSKIFSLYKYGEGRVVGINYRDLGGLFLTPADKDDLNYEYYQSFIIKTILWAGKNEPKILFKEIPGKQTFGINQNIPEIKFKLLNTGKDIKTKISLSIRSPKILYNLPSYPISNFGLHQTEPLVNPVYSQEKEVNFSSGEKEINFSLPQLPCGKYFVDIEISSENKKINWATIPLEIQKEGSVIAKIKIEPDAVDIEKTNEINVKVILLEPLKQLGKLNLSVIDNYNRVLSEKQINLKEGEILIETKLPISDISTTLGRVRGELYIGNKLVSIETGEFTVFNRNWDDFTFFAWANIGRDYVSRQRARIAVEYGIDAFRGGNSIENLRVVDVRCVPDLWRFGSKVKDKKYVEPCFSDPENRKEKAKRIKEFVEKYRKFDPFAFLHGDEFFFIGGGLPGGCHTESCIENFRKYLENQYKTIRNLNKQWDTNYEAFDEIMPLDEKNRKELEEKAKITKNYSYLIDQWLYNYFIFVDMMKFCYETLRKVDPDGKIRIGCSTPLWNWYYRGYDWSQIMKYINFFTPYGPWGDMEQREAGRSFAKKGIVLSGHYGSYVGDGQIVDEGRQKIVPYVLLFNGCSNAFWYNLGQGGETGISPSLEPYPCFKVSSKEIQNLKNGIAKLILPTKVINNNVAIYWSTPSYLFSFLVSGPHVPWRINTLIYALEEMGYQYDFVSPEQVVKEDKLKNYKVLFLPISQCIGKDEAEKIKEFVKNGGIVIADVKVGNFDEHGKIWKESPVLKLFGIKYKDPLQPVGKTNFQFKGEYKGISFSGPLLEEVLVDTSLVLNGAKCVFDINGTPLITYNDYGKGTAICLNTTHADGSWDINTNFRNILKVLLSAHNINPDIEIKTEIKNYIPGGFIPGFEFHHFVDGDAEYFALSRRKVKTEGDEIKGIFSIKFEKERHLYDVLGGKYIGYKGFLEDEISPYEVKLYALLPYKLNEIDVHLKKERFSPGEYIEGEVEIKMEGNPVRHVINLQVKRPDEALVRYLRQNLETKTGKVNFKIPLALNEPEGNWELIFTDVATGIKKSIKVSIKK